MLFSPPFLPTPAPFFWYTFAFSPWKLLFFKIRSWLPSTVAKQNQTKKTEFQIMLKRQAHLTAAEFRLQKQNFGVNNKSKKKVKSYRFTSPSFSTEKKRK
jgi:hypothetical protein